MGFSQENQEFYAFSFFTVSEKKKMTKFFENLKKPVFRAVFAQIWAKMNFFQKSGSVSF